MLVAPARARNGSFRRRCSFHVSFTGLAKFEIAHRAALGVVASNSSAPSIQTFSGRE